MGCNTRQYKFRQWTTGWASGKCRMIYLGDIRIEDFSLLTVGEPMQFTGQTDKNGVEIYEGDIIDYIEESIGGYNDMVGVVKFLECAWWIDDEARSFANPLFSETATLEVIGNIYETEAADE